MISRNGSILPNLGQALFVRYPGGHLVPVTLVAAKPIDDRRLQLTVEPRR
ncbi:MAG TPA: hypothetical protein VFF69_09020 [Phycisphaerales bacterium]|nr:hypothetical protein [Phycisphaerales bacterium]